MGHQLAVVVIVVPNSAGVLLCSWSVLIYFLLSIDYLHLKCYLFFLTSVLRRSYC